ncbi:MAG: M24 family metallopeptidase [Thermodesulfobacteriota bacterium]
MRESDQQYTPLPEIRSRVDRLQDRLRRQDITGALILQNSDLFYFSGTAQQAQLYIPADGEPILMVRKDLNRASVESPLAHIEPINSPRQIPAILKRYGFDLPARLGLECDVLPANLYLGFQDLFAPGKLLDISTDIRMLRAVKSEYEIERLRKAVRLSDRLADAVPALLREGMTEIELAGLIEATARKWGHQGIIRMRLWGSELFYGHVMAGASAAAPSYLSSPTGGIGVNPAVAQGSSLQPIAPHVPVLVDFVFALDGYLSDHTRIFSIGELPDDLVTAHKAMLTIQELIKQTARPGISCGRLYEAALEKAADLGLADHFMGSGKQRIRFVGHGIGLELDEFPFLAKGQEMTLTAGMIIALEPKAVFEKRGVVGIENTHLVTESGLEQFGRFQEDIVIV